ncbi:MFS transporter [Streptomyces sp. NPDC007851]|uniref:MFS transporter n=1 Tax=Streptomyces sp. NPDC007851 TaxID=3155008 RepID=UPI0033F9CE6B
MARSASTVGDNMYTVAVVFAALRAGGSGAIGLVLAAEMLPKLLLSSLAGMASDRWRPASILALGDWAAGCVTAFVAVMIATGHNSVVMLVAASVLLGAATSFFDPAALKLISTGFAKERRKDLNANLGIASSVSRVLGPTLAGFLVAAAGTASVVALNGLSFVASALLFTAVGRTAPRESGERQIRGGEGTEGVAAGFRDYFRIGWLWRLGVQTNVVLLFGVALLNVAGPVYAAQAHGGAKAWGLVQACNGAGWFAGRLAARRHHFQRPAQAAAVCLFTVALPVLVIGVNGGLAALAAAQAISGCGLALRSTLWGGLVATAIDESIIGRIVSVEQVMGLLTASASMAVVGGLISALGLRVMPLIGFTAVVVISAAVTVAPALRRLTEPSLTQEVSS